MTTKIENETSDKTDPQTDTQSPSVSASLNRFLRALARLRWFTLYVATISTMIWWYEFRPGQLASMKMQGDWQWFEGTIPNEQPLGKYLRIDKGESWFVYPLRNEWSVQRDRLSIHRANNFFVVRRAFGFDYGTTRETEYIVCLKNDGMYVLRGLARLDSVIEPSVEKLRNIASLPNDAQESIRTYLSQLDN